MRLVLAMILMSVLSDDGTPANAAAPEGWEPSTPRAEIAPRFRVEHPAGGGPSVYCLGMSGQGDPFVDGRWLRKVPVTPGKHYRFKAEFHTEGIARPSRSVLVRIIWLDAAGKSLGNGEGEYPPTLRRRTADGWSVIADVYPAPERGGSPVGTALPLGT